MNSNQSMASLLASSLHEMRNILAVIRESAGLANDLSPIIGSNAGPDGNSGDSELLRQSLQGVQNAVNRATALTSALEYMAQQTRRGGDRPRNSDLWRVCESFCLMGARNARASKISLCSAEASQPVWAEVPVQIMFTVLQEIITLCTAVGGMVDLRLAAAHQNQEPGIMIAITGGENRAMTLAALTGKPIINCPEPGWSAFLQPCQQPSAGFGQVAGNCCQAETGQGEFFLVVRPAAV